ncbi:HET-domain-containing protein [Daldinia eschscholtzii]|nr:HET-domain-containing protein [Daldinia eschscholtzii]
MTESYIYEPLPSSRSIRLISLAPSLNPNAPIQCDITTIELDAQPPKVPYEALSYVWGSPKGTIPILCNGMELRVMPNCHDALRHLRFRFSRRILWVDAVCIDQGSDDRATRERNSQVQMMGDVYENASRVLIWLGTAHEYTPRIFLLLGMAGTITCLSEMYRFMRLPAKLTLKMLTRRLEDDVKKSRYIQGLRYLFENKWFFRVWTSQEVVFARESVLICGASHLDWTVFNLALGVLPDLDPDLGMLWLATSRRITNIQTRRLKKTTSDQVVQTSPPSRNNMPLKSRLVFEKMDMLWMRSLGHLQCSIPHDKVYGLYLIFKASGLELPDVDYGKTVQEVYGDATKSLIRTHHRGLNILLVSIRPQDHDDFPTWIPNWNISHMPGTDPLDKTGNWPFEGSSYRASGDSFATIPSFTPPGELQVKGIIVGGVQKIVVSSTAGENQDVVGSKPFYLNFIRACREWFVRLDSVWEAEIYQGRGVPTEAMKNVLAFQKFNGKGDMEPKQLEKLKKLFYCWVDVFMYPACFFVTAQDMETVAQLDPNSAAYPEIIQGALNTSKIMSSGNAISDAVKTVLVNATWFHYKVCFELANWGFLFLETGHIGRAYYNCREKDKVALLAGSSVPFVLREVGHDRYQLVAPAYIYGIMDGESWPADGTGVKDMILV